MWESRLDSTGSQKNVVWGNCDAINDGDITAVSFRMRRGEAPWTSSKFRAEWSRDKSQHPVQVPAAYGASRSDESASIHRRATEVQEHVLATFHSDSRRNTDSDLEPLCPLPPISGPSFNQHRDAFFI